MQVVSAPKAIKVLAPACTALLNLSSYVPAQVRIVHLRGPMPPGTTHVLSFTGLSNCFLVGRHPSFLTLQVEMCSLSLKLLLHLNSKYTGLNGYSTTIKGSQQQPGHGGHRSPGARAGPSDSPLVQELLYATSGCLHNLSRNPHNAQTLYEVELRVKTRRAAADLLLAGDPAALAAAAAPAPVSVLTASRGGGTVPLTGRSAAGGQAGNHIKGLAPVPVPSLELTVTQYEVRRRRRGSQMQGL